MSDERQDMVEVWTDRARRLGLEPAFTIRKVYLATRYEAGHEARKEPDLMIGRCVETGAPFAIVRQASPLTLSAYIGVSESHPIAELQHYHEYDVRCHGGVSYASEDAHYAQGNSINELIDAFDGPAPDFWIGFDCIHAWDLSPCPDYDYFASPRSEYRTFQYVLRECASLAQQLYERAR